MKKVVNVTSESSKSWLKYLPVLLPLLGVLLYFNTIGNVYNMDDELVTIGHKYTSKGLGALPDILANPYYSDAMGYKYGYRPLVHVSFAVEHQFFGENPHISHFINVLLYALCVYLFFRILKTWTGDKDLTMAVVATVIFVVHPVHTEVVASIKNRDEILALLLGLLAGISFFKQKGKPSISALLFASLSFAMALLAKKSMYPLTIVFPVVSMILYRRPIKDVLFYAAFIVVPGAVLVSEFNLMRIFVLLVFPVTVILAVYYAMSAIQKGWPYLKDKYIAKILDYRVAILTAPVLLAIGIWNNSLPIMLFTLVLLIFFAWKSPELGTPILILCFAWMGYIQSTDFVFGVIILAIIYLSLSKSLLGKDALKKWGVLVFVWAVYIYGDWQLGELEMGDSLMVVLFFIAYSLLRINRLWGIFLLSVFFVLAGIVLNIYYQIYVPILLLVVILYEGTRSKLPQSLPKYILVYALSVLFLVVFIYESVDSLYWTQTTVPTELSEGETEVSSMMSAAKKPLISLKEGRQLEFAENTLTAPHTLSETIGTGAITLGEYLRLMVFPWELSFYYGYAKIDTVNLANPWVWLSLLVHLGLLVLALWQITKRPFVSIGILWYLLSIGLFSNWVELVAGMVAERLAFTASVGFCILVAALIVWIKPSLDFKKPGWVEAGLLLICVVFSFRTIVRNADWKDRLTLMGRDIRHLDNSAQANNLYALNLMGAVFGREGNYTEEQKRNMMLLALTHFDRAVQIWPDFFNASYDKGRVALTLGDKQTAMAAFEHAVSIKRKEVFSDPYYQLDKLYFEFRMYDKLLKNAKAITRIEDNPEVYNRLAKGYYYVGKPDSSIYYLDMGLQRYPNDNSILQNKSEIMRHFPLVQ